MKKREEIKMLNVEEREGVPEEIDPRLKKMQDEAFMKGYEYAIQILNESMVVLIDAKNQTT